MHECNVCCHAQRALVDSASKVGWSIADFKGVVAVKTQDVWRHQEHLNRQAAREDAEAMLSDEESVIPLTVGALRMFRKAQTENGRLLQQSQRTGDSQSVQSAIRNAELLVRTASRFDAHRSTEVSSEEQFLRNPKWTDFKTRLLQSLESFPEAYRAVLESLDA